MLAEREPWPARSEGGASAVASAFGVGPSLSPNLQAANTAIQLGGGLSGKALAGALAAQGSPIGAVAVAAVGGFSFGMGLNSLFNQLTGTTLGDLAFDYLNPPEPPGGQCQ